MRDHTCIVHLSDFLLIFQLGYLVVGKILMLSHNTKLCKKSVSLCSDGLLFLHVQLELIILLDQGVYDRKASVLGGWLRHRHAQCLLDCRLDIPVGIKLVANSRQSLSWVFSSVKALALWHTS